MELGLGDAELAIAMGETLRGMGVHAPEGMRVAEEAENTIADEEWVRFFGMLQGIQGGAGGRMLEADNIEEMAYKRVELQ